jgi:hypothetical protein
MATLFVYMGHTMSARIHGDAQLEVLSLHAKPTTYGTYPVNFAEGEAWDILSEGMENQHAESIKEANVLLANVIKGWINDGTFEEFAPKRGIFVKW